MSKRNGHPRWWQTWVCLGAFAFLCLVVARTHLSATGHTAAQIGAVLLVYGLLFLWLRANQGACLSEACDEAAREMDGLAGDLGAAPESSVEIDGRGTELPPSLHPRSV